MGHDWTKALLIFDRGNKRTDHCVSYVRVAQGETIQLAQPVEQTRNITIPPQVAGIMQGWFVGLQAVIWLVQ